MRIRKINAPMARVGKVKIGMKNQNGYPMSLDYFVFQTKYGVLNDFISEKYGDKPKEIDITFFSNEDSMSCSHHYVLRDKGGNVVSKGDGYKFVTHQKGLTSTEIDLNDEKFHLEDSEHYKKIVEQAKKLSIKSEDHLELVSKTYMKSLAEKYDGTTGSGKSFEAKWEEVMVLRFMIPDMPVAGYWELTSKGKASSINQVVSHFDAVRDSLGSVVGTPFQLSVSKHKSNNVGTAGRIYPVIALNAVKASKHNIIPSLDSENPPKIEQ